MTKRQTPEELDPTERKKRRRELLAVGGLGALFIVLTWILFKLFGLSEQLPFAHSIYFFGLVNFNIIVLLLLMFFVFRNVVKQFAEREGGPLGSSLKNKLIAAFVGFSFVPTALMFIVSVFYINNSFDRWFNEKVTGVLKSSIEITNTYFLNEKKRNYHFASEISKALQSNKNPEKQLSQFLNTFSLDAVEYYPGLYDERVAVFSQKDGVPELPQVSLELRQKGIESRDNSSVVHRFAEGNIVRVIVPMPDINSGGAIVVSSYIPESLLSKIADISEAHESFRDSDPLAYPIKSIYLIILVLMTFVILLCATWFGFYLARQLSIPLEKLDQATQHVVRGEYKAVDIQTGSPEINRLITNFNTMTAFLGESEREVQEANRNLRKTLSQLDEHSRYIEVVLGSVTTGVISIDSNGIVTTINHHAASLLKIEPEKYVNKSVHGILGVGYEKFFTDLFDSMKQHQAQTVRKEIQISISGKPLLLSATITVLADDKGVEMGKLMVFDDLTPMVAAQRAAAWTEVARRIAHEIKNPLTPISLAAQRLQRKFGGQITDPAFSDSTKMIIDQVDGLKTLVNEFSQYARMPRSQPALSNLNQVIANALQLFQQSERSYALKFDPDPKLPEFLFDSDQIRRALTNLVDNAVETVKDVSGAQVTIETQYDSLSKIARLIVSDNGKGVPANLRGRIFEPYVTSKVHGTGLGLAIVKRTVEDHNGYIRAFENKPNGTRFVIELPVIISNTADQVVRAKLKQEESKA